MKKRLLYLLLFLFTYNCLSVDIVYARGYGWHATPWSPFMGIVLVVVVLVYLIIRSVRKRDETDKKQEKIKENLKKIRESKALSKEADREDIVTEKVNSHTKKARVKRTGQELFILSEEKNSFTGKITYWLEDSHYYKEEDIEMIEE